MTAQVYQGWKHEPGYEIRNGSEGDGDRLRFNQRMVMLAGERGDHMFGHGELWWREAERGGS